MRARIHSTVKPNSLARTPAGAEAPDPEEGWTDPMEQDGCPWRHLSEDGANFIDTEFEFVKGLCKKIKH